MFKRILLDDAPPEGGNGNPPVVAKTAMTGTISEREVDLQAQIDVLKAERDGAQGHNKKLETDLAHLQNQLAELRNPKPQTTPADDRSELEKWMDGE